MDVTTMQPIETLAERIKKDYKHIVFIPADDFCWSPDTSSVSHPPLISFKSIWSLLHEIAHGQLRHNDFGSDIELVKYEADAWAHAHDVLAPVYNLQIDDDYIQDHLDTYRDWLHKRSLCPECGLNGIQTQNTYSCINCRCLWRANDARLCALKRVRLQA